MTNQNILLICLAFAALSISATGAPAISNVSSSSITGSAAMITWTTKQPSTTRVAYGLTSSYGSFTTLDSTLVTTHSANITGLTASKLYHYVVISANNAGNSTTSEDFTFSTLSTLTAQDYTNPILIFTEPTTPTVSLNGTYTTFGNKVTRITDSSTTGCSVQGCSPWYVDRSALNADDTRLMIVNQSGGWYVMPMTTAGAAGAETIQGGTAVALPLGGGGPGAASVGSWDPLVSNRYWMPEGKKLWSLDVTSMGAMVWTLRKDFTLPSFTAYGSLPCPVTSAARLFLSYTNGAKFAFYWNQASKLSFGTLIYDFSTDTVIRFDAGNNVMGRAPSSSPSPSTGYHGVSVDKGFAYMLQQEGDLPLPCNTGGLVKQYRVPISSATNTFGTSGVPAPSVAGNEVIGHGSSLTAKQLAYMNDIPGWTTTNVPSGFEFVQGIRRYDLTLPAETDSPFRLPNTVPFAWGYGTVTGYHMSANANSDTWAYLSTYQTSGSTRLSTVNNSSGAPLAHELVAFNTTAAMTNSGCIPTGSICGQNILRLGHHFSAPYLMGGTTGEYYAQPHATNSLSRKWLVFGTSMLSSRYDIYIMRLPTSVRP